jgi:hypothetical protein
MKVHGEVSGTSTATWTTNILKEAQERIQQKIPDGIQYGQNNNA